MAEQIGRLTIPLGYPRQCSQDQIAGVIRTAQDQLETQHYSINAVMQWSPIIQLGLAELQDRAAKRSTRLAKVTLAIVIVSVILSLFVGVVSFLSLRSNKEWQERQLDLLERIEEHLAQ